MVKKYLKLILLFILLGMTLAFSRRSNIIFTLIITAIYFIAVILNKLVHRNKNEITIPEIHTLNTKYLSIVLSILVFIISMITYRNVLPLKENIYESLIILIINLLITYPIRPNIFSKELDIYDISCTKTIVSEQIPSLADIVFLNNMGINLIIFNKRSVPKKISMYFEKVIPSKIKNHKDENLYITEYKKEDVNKALKTNTLYAEDVTESLLLVKKSRGLVDNLIRAIKMNDIMSYSLSLLIIIPLLYGFPQLFNNRLLLVLFLIINIICNFLISKTTFDYDVYTRKPRSLKDKIFTKQEVLFNIFSILAIFICVSTIYMAALSKGATFIGATSICLIIYLLSFAVIYLIHYSESLAIINFFKILKNLYSIIIIALVLILTIVIKYIPFIEVQAIGWNNYRSSLLLAIICTIWYDLTKIARYFKKRKKDRYVETN